MSASKLEFNYDDVIIRPGHFGFGFATEGHWCPIEATLKLTRPVHRMFTPVLSGKDKVMKGMLDTSYHWEYHRTFCNGVRAEAPRIDYREPGVYGQGWIPSLPVYGARSKIPMDDGYTNLEHLLSKSFKLEDGSAARTSLQEQSLVTTPSGSTPHLVFMSGLLNHMRSMGKWSVAYACRASSGPWDRCIGKVEKMAERLSTNRGHIHRRFFAAAASRLTHSPRCAGVGLPESRMTRAAHVAWKDSWTGRYLMPGDAALEYLEVHMLAGKMYVNRNSGSQVRHYQIYINATQLSPTIVGKNLEYKFAPMFGQKTSILRVPVDTHRTGLAHVANMHAVLQQPAWSRALTAGTRGEQYPEAPRKRISEFLTPIESEV